MSLSATVEFENRFSVLPSQVERSIDAGVLRAGKLIADLASQLAPEDTGALKDSGDVERIAPGIVEVSFGNGLPDDRAVAQELGTLYMPPQPYLMPAAKEINVAQEIADVLIATMR